MCIFQPGIYLENCFNFKRDDESLQSRSILHCAIIPELFNKICAHQIVIFEAGKNRNCQNCRHVGYFLIARGLIRFYVSAQTGACYTALMEAVGGSPVDSQTLFSAD